MLQYRVVLAHEPTANLGAGVRSANEKATADGRRMRERLFVYEWRGRGRQSCDDGLCSADIGEAGEGVRVDDWGK